MRKSFSLLLLLVSVQPIFGQKDTLSKPQQTPESLSENFGLFSSDDLIDLNLKLDLTSYLRKKLKGLYLEGEMTIFTGNDSIVKNVKIRNRGFFRLQYCSFPPMELVLKKPLNAYRDGGAIRKLKLATLCRSGSLYEDYILREYLIYKMFNLFTDTSFRVRLVKTNYIDTNKERKPQRQFGFFIEPLAVLAERINSTHLKGVEITQRNVIPVVMLRLAIFNYMIGNYDWAVPNQHNVAVLKSNDPFAPGMAIAIPYDFDWSGVVNPMYAIPTEEVGIENVRERLYTGICLNQNSFRTELLKFLPYKQKIYSLINNFHYLNQKSKRDIISYLEAFFSQLENPNALDMLIDKLESTCKHL